MVGGRRFDPEQTRERLGIPQGGAGNTKQNMDVNDMNAMKEQSVSKLSLSCYS